MAQYKLQYSEVGAQRSMVEHGLAYAGRPFDAFKENVSNALDGIKEAFDKKKLAQGDGLVNIILSYSTRKLMVQDNGAGLSAEGLLSKMYSVGESEKEGRGDLSLIGEKGVGLLSFASLGWQMHMVTRLSKHSPYHAVFWEFDKKKGFSWEPVLSNHGRNKMYTIPTRKGHEQFTLGELTEDEVLQFAGGMFHQGTQIAIRPDEQIFNQFKEKVLAEKLRKIYWSLLENRVTRMSIREQRELPEGRSDTLRSKLLYPRKVLAEELADIRVPYLVKDMECELRAHLWVDPDREGGEVAYYNKGVFVMDNLLKFDDPALAACALWKDKHIIGYVECPHLKLTVGRDRVDVVRESNHYKRFVEELIKVNEHYWPIAEKKIHHRHDEKNAQYYTDILHDLSDVFRQIPALHPKVHGPRGPIIFVGTGGTSGESGGTDIPVPPVDKPPRGPKFLLKSIGASRFGIHEKAQRSRLQIEKGIPVGIELNRDHSNYQEIVEAAPHSNEALQYVVHNAIFPYVVWEMQTAEAEKRVHYETLEDFCNDVNRRVGDIEYAYVQSLPKKKR